MNTIGDQLADLLGSAETEATIVAPFAKAGVVQRLIQRVTPGVVITFITRWRPYEIKCGVSDLEVWDILQTRPPSSLSLVPNLHAKFYRADDRYVIGSANLTNAALGWSSQPNVELMISGNMDRVLMDWESSLVDQATIVDDSIVRFFKRLVDELPDDNLIFTEQTQDPQNTLYEGNDSPMVAVMSWLPMTRYPDQLYRAYSGQVDGLSAAARESTACDLLALAVPTGLTIEGFKASVAANLLQMPVIHQVDQFLAQPRSFGAMKDFLRGLAQYPQERDASTDWQTMMRWFRYFLPRRFHMSIPNYSEVTYRVE